MKLQRIEQILSGKDYHYVMINHFKILDCDKIDDLKLFTFEFVNSPYFVNEYVADIRKEKTEKKYLPFPFKIEKLQSGDFKIQEQNLDEYISEDLIRNSLIVGDLVRQFMEGFKCSIESLKEYAARYSFAKMFSVISIDDIAIESEKVVAQYQETGSYVFDYFYFGIVPLANKNEFITFELAYE